MHNVGKTIAIALVFIFLTSMVALQPATVKAQSKIITVPNDYPIIQTAVDNANAGDTVFVRKGTYDGAVIDKPLSLIGEDPKETIIQEADLRNGYEINVIDVASDNVTVSGFTLIGHRNAANIVIGVNVLAPDFTPTGCKIINNNIVNMTYGIYTSSNFVIHGAGVHFGYSYITISGNNITGNDWAGIQMGATNGTISNNTITGNGEYGIHVIGSDSEDFGKFENITVSSNTISNNNLV